MATPTFQWAWREEENLVNSHAAARRLGGNWIAYGDEESKFLESCYRMDPKHRGTSATTVMVKSKRFRPETGSMYRFDFVEMVQINAQTGHRRSMKRVAIRDAQAAPAAAVPAPATEVRPAKKPKPSPAPAAAPAPSPPARALRFGSGGRDAADAIDIDDDFREAPVAAPDFVSRLQALSALRDDGHLTDAEFAKAKQKLLDE